MNRNFDNLSLDLLRETVREFSDRGVDKNLESYFNKDKSIKITIVRAHEQKRVVSENNSSNFYVVKQFNLYDPGYSGGELLLKTTSKTKAYEFFRKQKKLMKLMGVD
jgi:hypothetical protein